MQICSGIPATFGKLPCKTAKGGAETLEGRAPEVGVAVLLLPNGLVAVVAALAHAVERGCRVLCRRCHASQACAKRLEVGL